MAYAVREDPLLGTRVIPQPVGPELVELVAEIHRVAWPVWLEPGGRALRGLTELCRLQTARGLTVLSWLASARLPDDRDWLLAGSRLAGARQRAMYAAATSVPAPVRSLVVANWSWATQSPHGGRVIAPYLASAAYPADGHAAAYAATTLWQVWNREADARPALAAAWAATRTPADWCTAAELRVRHGVETPVFSYPGRWQAPRAARLRPWIRGLLLDGRH